MKKSTFKKMTMLLLLLSAAMITNAAAITRYVTVSGAGTKDGTSWENAAEGTFTAIQAQIDAVAANAAPLATDVRGEIRFGAGTYDLSVGVLANTSCLTLKDGASLVGAYPASPITGSNDSRNLATNQTIFDGGGVRKIMNAPDASGIVYTHITLLDGIIFQRGYSSYGSAMAITYGFVLQNCIIRNNSGISGSGAAVRVIRNSFNTGANPTSTGGAFINCVFANNSTTKGASALVLEGSAYSSIVNCVFANNVTTDANLTKVRNTNTRGYFGTVHIGTATGSMRIVNNIFYNNSAVKDADKHLGSSYYVGYIYNNYFDGDQAWKDSVAVYYERPTSTTSAYYRNFTTNNNKCNVDYAASTIFASPNTVLGISTNQTELDAINNSDWRLKASSPCINAGISSTTADLTYPYSIMLGVNRAYSTVASDFSGSTRINGGQVDMGAHESNFMVTVTPVAGANGSVSAPVTVSLGLPVTVEATANSGYALAAWNDGVNNLSSSSSYTFIPTADVTLTATFSVSTGINELKDNSLVTVKGHIVELQNAVHSLEIYNAVGAKVYMQNNVAAGTVISLNHVGVYLIKVKSIQGIKIQKVVVK